MPWPDEKPRTSAHLHLGGGIEIVARHAIGAGRVAEGRDRADRHHVAGDVARLQVGDVAQRQAVGIVGLRRHAIGAAEDVEVVDEGRAHVDRQRLEDARDRHAELLGLGAVDVGVDLRASRVEQREGLGEAGRLAGRAGERPCRALERRQAAAGAILHVALEAAAGADAGHRGRLEHEHEGLAQREHLWRRSARMRVLGEPCLIALFERLQADEDHAGVGRVGEGGAVEADECDGVLHAGRVSMISDAWRTTASVRSSVEPGGS